MKKREGFRKIIACVLGTAVIIGSLAGCNKTSTPTDESATKGDNTSTEAVATEKPELTTIRVACMPYYLSVPLQVIKDEKLDEKFGFTMEMIGFPSGGPMAEALGAGQWDIGPIGAGGMVAVPTYNARLIADVEYQMDGAWIMARPDSDIVAAGQTLADYPELIGSAETLKGKTVLGTIGNISHYMGLDYLNKFGLGMSDVNFLNMETAQVYTSFEAGNGDLACIGSPSAGLQLLSEGYVIVGGLKQQGAPQQDSILVSDKFYTNNYEDTVKFMEAWYTATGMLNGDADYEKEMTKKFYSESGRTDFTDEAIAQECEWNIYIDETNVNEKELGKWMSDLVQFMVDNGTMGKEVVDAMKTNIRHDVIEDALKAMEK